MYIYKSNNTGIVRKGSICKFFIIRNIIADPSALTVSFTLHFWCMEADLKGGFGPDNERIITMSLIKNQTDTERTAALFAGSPYELTGETLTLSGATLIN